VKEHILHNIIKGVNHMINQAKVVVGDIGQLAILSRIFRVLLGVVAIVFSGM
jgi:hypothetical protein